MKQHVFNCGFEICAGMLMLVVNFYVYVTAVPAITVLGAWLVLVNLAGILFGWLDKVAEIDTMMAVYINLALLFFLIGWSVAQYLSQGLLSPFVQLTLPLQTIYTMVQLYFWRHH